MRCHASLEKVESGSLHTAISECTEPRTRPDERILGCPTSVPFSDEVWQLHVT